MKHSLLFGVALGLALVSILLFMAGQPRFDFLPRSYANFLGTAAILASGFVWIFWGTKARGKRE